MKKYVMNKHVEHNGKKYVKDSEIKESDDGFKSIVEAGHAKEFSFSEASESAEQSVEQEKPARKPGK
jgi:hypothetical protein